MSTDAPLDTIRTDHSRIAGDLFSKLYHPARGITPEAVAEQVIAAADAFIRVYAEHQKGADDAD